MTYVVTWQLLVLLSILSVKHTILLTLHELLASICFPYLLKSLFSSPTAFRQLAAHSLLSRYELREWRTWCSKNNPQVSRGPCIFWLESWNRKERASNLKLVFAGNKRTCYTLLNEARPWPNEVELAEDGRFQILLQMLETHFSTWSMRSDSKWCSSSKLLSIPNQLRTQ